MAHSNIQAPARVLAASCSQRVSLESAVRDPMKFKNGDVSLDDAVRRNGGRLAMSAMPTLSDTSW